MKYIDYIINLPLIQTLGHKSSSLVFFNYKIGFLSQEFLGGAEFGGYGHIREYTKIEVVELIAPLFNIIKFIPINDYILRGINFGRFNKLIPTSWSIDIGVLLENK